MRYNTGNPIGPDGSNDPRDLSDNAGGLDLAMGSEDEHWTDRLGRLRLTWAGIEGMADALFEETREQAEIAATQADRSQSEAERAEAARDAAVVESRVYASTADALADAGLAVGEQFQVLSGDGLSVLRYRKDPGPVATYLFSFPAAAAVDLVHRQMGGPDLHNLLTESESMFEDMSVLAHDFDTVLTTETYSGRRVMKVTPGVSGTASFSIQYLPISLFQGTGKISVAVTIEQADGSATDSPFLNIRQTSESAGGSALQNNQVSLPTTAISTPTTFVVENVTPHASARRVEFRVRRNGAVMRIGRIVITNGSTAMEVPLNALRAAQALDSAAGVVLPLVGVQRWPVDWANNQDDAFSPNFRISAGGAGMTVGATGRNLYMSGTDVSFREGVAGEATLRFSRLSGNAFRAGFAIGPGGRANTTRQVYVWNVDGLVQQFPGNFSGGASLLPASALRAIATSDVVNMRILRRADGTGQIGVTPASGIEYTAELTDVPLGRVWLAWRVDSPSSINPVELQQFGYHPVSGGSEADISALNSRVAGLENIVRPSTPILLNYSVIPDATPSRTPRGETCTGAAVITRGPWAGCILVGGDGRLIEGDGSPYIPVVHVMTPDAREYLHTFAMPYSGAGVQGVAVDTSGSDDTFWVSCAGDLTIRHFNLYGVNAGQEITGDRFDWSAAGYGSAPNGLCYVPGTDALYATPLSGTAIRLISCDPAASPRLLATGTGESGMDQLQYLNGELYYSIGANGSNGSIKKWNPVGGALSSVFTGLTLAQAIEGFIIQPDVSELLVFSDGGFHSVAAPALNIMMRYRIRWG